VLFDRTGNKVRDQVRRLVRNGGRAVFIALAAPPPPAVNGVEGQSFAATVDSTRLQASPSSSQTGGCGCQSRQSSPLSELQRDGALAARHTQGRVALRIGS